jgi:hypothetical protein
VEEQGQLGGQAGRRRDTGSGDKTYQERSMAKLRAMIDLETTEEYDQAVRENKQLRLALPSVPSSKAMTPMDQLGYQISKVLNGLRYVDRVELVDISKVISRTSDPAGVEDKKATG